eukprot:GHVP01024451.1.p1 GENE.GHVP01024451.1~~GHVP01024451.1.p1  ORF type:complete len:217 (-),score=39.79 GHVP01024451.1:123-710(-)
MKLLFLCGKVTSNNTEGNEDNPINCHNNEDLFKDRMRYELSFLSPYEITVLSDIVPLQWTGLMEEERNEHIKKCSLYPPKVDTFKIMSFKDKMYILEYGLNLLDSEHIKTFDYEIISSLNNNQIEKLSYIQLKALNVNQLDLFNENQINSLTELQISFLTEDKKTIIKNVKNKYTKDSRLKVLKLILNLPFNNMK